MDREFEQIIQGIDFEEIDKHPNILIAARFWDDPRYHAARVCYKFMRMIDDLIDNRKAMDESISCLEQAALSERVTSWIDCLDQGSNEDPFYEELSRTITEFKIPLQLFHNFARSMIHDINHNGFSTLDEFLEYAEGASVAPASIFVHLCCLSEEKGEYRIPDYDVMDVARPCAIFSYLVHIIRDFQEDQRNNLNYFAADMLRKHHLDPSDLRKIAEGAPVSGSFRELVGEYLMHAEKYRILTMVELEKQAHRLSGRYLFSLHLIYHLYRMVFDRIDVTHGRFTSEELNPTPQEIRDQVLEVASRY